MNRRSFIFSSAAMLVPTWFKPKAIPRPPSVNAPSRNGPS